MDDDVAARLRATMERCDAALEEAGALARSATPVWDGAAASQYRRALSEDMAALASLQSAVAQATAALVMHGRAVDEARAALLAASGVAGSSRYGTTRPA